MLTSMSPLQIAISNTVECQYSRMHCGEDLIVNATKAILARAIVTKKGSSTHNNFFT